MEVTTVAIDLAKNRVCHLRGERGGESDLAQGAAAGTVTWLHAQGGALPGRNGSVWRGALLGAPTRRARP